MFSFRKKFNLPIPFEKQIDTPVMAKYPNWVVKYNINSVTHTLVIKAQYLHSAVHTLQFEYQIHPKDLISVNLKE